MSTIIVDPGTSAQTIALPSPRSSSYPLAGTPGCLDFTNGYSISVESSSAEATILGLVSITADNQLLVGSITPTQTDDYPNGSHEFKITVTEQVTSTEVTTTIPITISITHIDCTKIVSGDWSVTIDSNLLISDTPVSSYAVESAIALTTGPHLV